MNVIEFIQVPLRKNILYGNRYQVYYGNEDNIQCWQKHHWFSEKHRPCHSELILDADNDNLKCAGDNLRVFGRTYNHYLIFKPEVIYPKIMIFTDTYQHSQRYLESEFILKDIQEEDINRINKIADRQNIIMNPDSIDDEFIIIPKNLFSVCARALIKHTVVLEKYEKQYKDILRYKSPWMDNFYEFKFDDYSEIFLATDLKKVWDFNNFMTEKVINNLDIHKQSTQIDQFIIKDDILGFTKYLYDKINITYYRKHNYTIYTKKLNTKDIITRITTTYFTNLLNSEYAKKLKVSNLLDKLNKEV